MPSFARRAIYRNARMRKSIPAVRRSYLLKGASRGTVLRGIARRGIRFASRRSPYMYGAALAYGAGKAMFSRARIGERVGSGGSKRLETTDTQNQVLNTRQLYQFGMMDIAQGTGIGERLRRVANVRGFKICMEVKNVSTEPMYFNVAVLSVKSGASQAGINNTDFFRASNNFNRGVDFGVTLNSNEFHCLPINTDRYIILRHKRYRLVPPNAGSTVSHRGLSYMNINWYIPLKRQIRWDEDTATNPEAGAVFLVFWSDLMFTAAGGVSQIGAMNVSTRTVTYFREPKN